MIKLISSFKSMETDYPLIKRLKDGDVWPSSACALRPREEVSKKIPHSQRLSMGVMAYYGILPRSCQTRFYKISDRMM